LGDARGPTAVVDTGEVARHNWPVHLVKKRITEIESPDSVDTTVTAIHRNSQ